MGSRPHLLNPILKLSKNLLICSCDPLLHELDIGVVLEELELEPD